MALYNIKVILEMELSVDEDDIENGAMTDEVAKAIVERNYDITDFEYEKIDDDEIERRNADHLYDLLNDK